MITKFIIIINFMDYTYLKNLASKLNYFYLIIYIIIVLYFEHLFQLNYFNKFSI